MRFSWKFLCLYYAYCTVQSWRWLFCKKGNSKYYGTTTVTSNCAWCCHFEFWWHFHATCFYIVGCINFTYNLKFEIQNRRNELYSCKLSFALQGAIHWLIHSNIQYSELVVYQFKNVAVEGSLSFQCCSWYNEHYVIREVATLYYTHFCGFEGIFSCIHSYP